MDEKLELTIPDYVTLSNALLGFLSITYIIDGRLWLASIIIIVCVILDGIDGALARYLETEHEIGAYMDFFSDIVSFCFAPALLLYTTFYEPSLGRSWQSVQNALATIVPFILVFTGTLRLSRFADQNPTRKRYSGIPTPSLALIVVHLSYLLGWGESTYFIPYWTLSIVAVLTPLLYCRIDYPKLRKRKIKIGGGLFMFLVFLAFLGIPYYNNPANQILIFTTSIILGYVFISPLILKIHGRGKRKDG